MPAHRGVVEDVVVNQRSRVNHFDDVAQDERTAREGLQATSALGVPWIAPEDVAPLVVFLASDRARMVSGTSFAATAGDSANVTA